MSIIINIIIVIIIILRSRVETIKRDTPPPCLNIDHAPSLPPRPPLAFSHTLAFACTGINEVQVAVCRENVDGSSSLEQSNGLSLGTTTRLSHSDTSASHLDSRGRETRRPEGEGPQIEPQARAKGLRNTPSTSYDSRQSI